MTREPRILDAAFTSVLVESGRIRHDIDFGEWCRHIRTVDGAVMRLCDAIEGGDASATERCARDAYLAVLALAQMLHGAYSEDPRTLTTVELTQLAVGQLLDALEPFVTREQRDARRVLLDGEPLDTALERVFCA